MISKIIYALNFRSRNLKKVYQNSLSRPGTDVSDSSEQMWLIVETNVSESVG